MADIEEAATVFPEVEIEKLKKIYQHYEHPSLARIANVLEQAKTQGKVPDADYRGRVEETIPKGERHIHPELAAEIEKMGFDPAEAEDGLRAEEEVERGEWEKQAIATARDGTFSDVMDLYLRLDRLIKRMLKSPTRSNIPEDPEIAMHILGKEMQKRIEDAGLKGEAGQIESMFKEVTRIPNEELREGYIEVIRPWRRLARNEGTQADKARRWVFEAEGEAMVDRIEELRTGDKFDVTGEQIREIIEEARQRLEAEKRANP